MCVWYAQQTRFYFFFFKKGDTIKRVLLLLLLLYFSLKLHENKSVTLLWTQCAREKFMSEEKIPPAIVAINFGFILLLRTLDSLQRGVTKQ
jgi:hypothetical protein